ncbi:MAG: hypothetical protein KF716_27900 [Anaerolineae bacterium]|nr:hypothetical protein [Anaerolineae bacterium]
MSEQNTPSLPKENLVPQKRYYVLRVRRYSLADWSGWIIWLLALGILFEFAITSLAEDEPQAGILAGVIAFGLLLAKIIVEVMKSIDLSNKYNDTQPPVNIDDNDDPAE